MQQNSPLDPSIHQHHSARRQRLHNPKQLVNPLHFLDSSHCRTAILDSILLLAIPKKLRIPHLQTWRMFDPSSNQDGELISNLVPSVIFPLPTMDTWHSRTHHSTTVSHTNEFQQPLFADPGFSRLPTFRIELAHSPLEQLRFHLWNLSTVAAKYLRIRTLGH